MQDNRGRNLHYLRVSVTDRCDLRCRYCMPPGAPGAGARALDDAALLRLIGVFARAGFDRVRLTGGEPLLRDNLAGLVQRIARLSGVRRIALTTNGVRLAAQLDRLRQAGLDSVNISLDTLSRAQYAALTGVDALPAVQAGLQCALETKGLAVKLNCVMLEENKDQFVPLAALARAHPIAVRLIELMPIGQGAGQTGCREQAALARLTRAFGPARPCPPPEDGQGPAHYVTFDGFLGRVGFISAVSRPFCASCNRVRLTADGTLKTCLQYDAGCDLGALLRAGASDETLLSAVRQAVWGKPAGHHFGGAPTGQDETRTMNRIGG